MIDNRHTQRVYQQGLQQGKVIQQRATRETARGIVERLNECTVTFERGILGLPAGKYVNVEAVIRAIRASQT